jgi:hypothetical protein
VLVLAWADGSSCCSVRESRVLTIFIQVLRTEGIAVMTMLVSKYIIEIKEEPEFACETFEERYARITAFDQGLTVL